MLDQTTRFLFEDSFPREIGKKRNLCIDAKDFEQKLDILNGVDEAFTNVNPLNGSINKIFNDFDGPHSLEEAQKQYQFLLNKNIPTIPLASGKKGIHLHSLFKTRNEDDNKEVLYKATKSLLTSGLGTSSKSVDPCVIGDLRRLCRIPNTLRPPENSSYCAYLPAGKAFLEMKNIDLSWYIKGTHSYPLEDYLGHSGLPNIKDSITPEIEKQKVTFETQCSVEKSVTYTDNEHLKLLIRPCLYRLLTVEEPRHHIRVASTGDLLRLKFSPNQVLDMYRTLKWTDWNEEYALYQIQHCKPIHYSRTKLAQLGACYRCGRSCS